MLPLWERGAREVRAEEGEEEALWKVGVLAEDDLRTTQMQKGRWMAAEAPDSHEGAEETEQSRLASRDLQTTLYS